MLFARCEWESGREGHGSAGPDVATQMAYRLWAD